MTTKIIFIDGPDVSGKSTLIKNMVDWLPWIRELNFNKGLTGLLRINTPSHFEILRVLLPNLSPGYTYIVDRCYFSNIVYDKVLRNEDAQPSIDFRKWCKENLKVLEILLDRDYINEDFNDDLIKVDKNTFNDVIDAYRAIEDVDYRGIILNSEVSKKKIEDLIYKFN